jgi:hypothetical protein
MVFNLYSLFRIHGYTKGIGKCQHRYLADRSPTFKTDPLAVTNMEDLSELTFRTVELDLILQTRIAGKNQELTLGF